ncbi:MAG TPA: FAD-dependent oxidoreductase [Acidimicrobiales bacterium]|nr:FAD-dependent oxidoreductase [Acidimicrobiales bacterium]
MSDPRRFVIVGASLAGAKAAETLRREGFEGSVALVGEEAERPYERPPLSKEYLRGEAGPEMLYVHADGFYEAQGVDLRLSSTVTSLDVEDHSVTLATGERLGYDSLLLSTGARPRRLALPGAELPGVYYLRERASSDTLREAIKAAGRAVIVGAGWIGCEVAASARQLGAEVAIVEMGQLPLQKVLGSEMGQFYQQVHQDHGVEMYFGVAPEAVVGSAAAEGVRLADGRTVLGGIVVVGIGVEPRDELAEQGGLETGNGVLTDEYLETSRPGVFAAGDIANSFHPLFGERVRLEHWSAARNQGPAAARNMLGRHEPYTRVPYFYSDQYDVSMEYSGHAPSWDEVIFRGDVEGRQFIAFWLKEGRVAAGMNVNIWEVSGEISDLVASRRTVDTKKLADPEVSLASV